MTRRRRLTQTRFNAALVLSTIMFAVFAGAMEIL